MPSFTFMCDHGDGKVVTFKTEEDFLDNLVEDFTFFLKGCGFHFDGQFEIIREEDTKESAYDWNNNFGMNSTMNSTSGDIDLTTSFPFPETNLDFRFDPNNKGEDILIQIDDTPQPTYSVAGSLDDDFYSRR